MIVGQAIELLFDKEAEDRIAEVWSATGEGIDLIALGARPHISLTVLRPPQATDLLRESVEHLASITPSFDVRLASVAAFPGDEGVVYLSPEPSPALIDAQAQVFRLLQQAGLEVDPLYRPDVWIPHCTMALEVPPERVDRVCRGVERGDVLGRVRIEQVQLVEFRPVRELGVFSLARN